MTDRQIRMVEDEDLTIERVSISNSKVSDMEPNDDFAQPADELRLYQGTSSVLKRRVSTQIKKFQRGTGGAETKQVIDKAFLTGYDAFDVVEPPHNLDHLAKLYHVSPVHYSAVNAKVSNIVGLGYTLVENSKSKRNFERIADDETKTANARRRLDQHRDDIADQLEKMNEEDNFTEILVKVWRDYETMGNGYLEVGRKQDGTIGYLGHIPAQSMRIRRKRDGFVQVSGFDVQFFANYGAGVDENGNPQKISNPIGDDVPNEVLHFKKYSPVHNWYGVPDVLAAQHAIAGNKFAAEYNLDYFENKAVPRYAIILKGAKLGQAAENQLLSFFETGLKGQNHRSVYIPLPAGSPDNPVDLKLQAIETGTQDSSFSNYRKNNNADILMADQVPITKVSIADGTNLAIARDADKTFKEQVCGPEQNKAEKKINRIIHELTDALDIKLTEMTLTDENTQSQIDERYVKNGVILPNEVRANKGMSGIPGGNDRVDPNAKAKQAQTNANANRQRDAVRSANQTDNAGEARNPKGDGRTTP